MYAKCARYIFVMNNGKIDTVRYVERNYSHVIEWNTKVQLRD